MGGHLVRIAAESPDHKLIITGQVSIPYAQLYHSQRNSYGIPEIFLHGIMHMTVYTFKDTVYQSVHPGYPSIHGYSEYDQLNCALPIDPTQPSYSMEGKPLKIFKYVDSQKPEIFIPPTAVDQCLDLILKLQYPEQEKIKKGLILPTSAPKIQAQIFSLTV